MTDSDLFFTAVAMAFAVWFYVVLPISMATARGRSAVAWLLVSLIFSPVIAILGLLIAGRAR